MIFYFSGSVHVAFIFFNIVESINTNNSLVVFTFCEMQENLWFKRIFECNPVIRFSALLLASCCV